VSHDVIMTPTLTLLTLLYAVITSVVSGR